MLGTASKPGRCKLCTDAPVQYDTVMTISPWVRTKQQSSRYHRANNVLIPGESADTLQHWLTWMLVNCMYQLLPAARVW